MRERLPSLDAIEAACWQELSRAPHDKHHDWRTPVLATVVVDADGSARADARTVVLREVDTASRSTLIYTDGRATKVAHLRTHPDATLLLWSDRLGWQLRCRVRCEVEHDGLAVSSRWARLKLSPGAQDYLSPLAPGMPLDAAPDGRPTALPVDRHHFAVITARFCVIDWLELHPLGHRRAVFGDGAARWVQA